MTWIQEGTNFWHLQGLPYMHMYMYIDIIIYNVRQELSEDNELQWSGPVFARSFLDHKPKGQVTDKFQKPKKNYTGPNLLLPKHWRFGNFDMINLPETSSKERNSGLFCPIFLKFTFDNFTSPVGLVILKYYLPGPNFTSLGLVLSFEDWWPLANISKNNCHLVCLKSQVKVFSREDDDSNDNTEAINHVW